MGSLSVTTGALLQCSFGLAPTTLNILPMSRVTIEGRPAAAIADMVPMVNIPPFGMCSSIAKTTIGGKPALVSGSTCVCSFGGVITITMPGALRTTAG
jgi:uncharacterized Zn-binding protein involved in type VI secretion